MSTDYSTPAVRRLASLVEGLPLKQPAGRTSKVAKYVTNFWLDEAARLYTKVQDLMPSRSRQTALAIGHNALQYGTGTVKIVSSSPAMHEFKDDNIIDKSDPSHWRNPQEAYDWARDNTSAENLTEADVAELPTTYPEISLGAVAAGTWEALATPDSK